MDRKHYIQIITEFIERLPKMTLNTTDKLSVIDCDMWCGVKYDYQVPIKEITISCNNPTEVWNKPQFEVNLWGVLPNGCDRVFDIEDMPIETIKDIINIINNN